mgnify:FL=1
MMNDEQRMSVSDYFDGGAKTSPAPQSQITEGGGANEGRSHPSAGANNGDNGGGAGEGSNRALSEGEQRDEDNLTDRFNREQMAVEQANNHPTNALSNAQKYRMSDIVLGPAVKANDAYAYEPINPVVDQTGGFTEALNKFFTPNAESIAANQAAGAKHLKEIERQRVANGGYVEQLYPYASEEAKLMREYKKQDQYPTFGGQLSADVDEAVNNYKETGGPMAAFGKGLSNLLQGKEQGPAITTHTAHAAEFGSGKPTESGGKGGAKNSEQMQHMTDAMKQMQNGGK